MREESMLLEPPADLLATNQSPAVTAPVDRLARIVIQFGGRTLKGYTDRSQWPAEAESAQAVTPPVRLLGSADDVQIPLEGVKAIFFVETFEGKWHEDLRFHDHLVPQECLWIRATFHDGEVIEGLIENQGSFVLHDGFYLFPVDPEGNNQLIYVRKAQLANFQVLGLRPMPRTMPRMGSLQ